MAKYQCICVVCKTIFTASRPTTKTCSRTCMGKNQAGKNNPNFGNKWSADRREEFSQIKKEQFKNDPTYAHACGKSNRGVKFSEDRIKAMHGHRNSASYSHLHTEETKKIIGKKSKEKFTPEFKEKFRRSMEELGHWVKETDKNPYDIYYKEANWIGSMVEFFDEKSLKVLNECGIYSHKNPKGWVRDHIVPRMTGYEFLLPPQLLRHPANLQFISHGDNISKGFADRKLTKNEKIATIELLEKRILEFTADWAEHSWCIDYIRNKNENMDNLGHPLGAQEYYEFLPGVQGQVPQ